MSSKMRKISLVATDMDGTFLKDDHKIIPRNAAMFRRLHEQGVHIVLASGRMTSSILAYEKHLPGVDFYMISYNGAVCLGSKGCKHITSSETQFDRPVLFQNTISGSVLSNIIDFVQEKGLFLNVYCNGGVYTAKNPAHDHYWKAYSHHAGIEYTFVDSLDELKSTHTPKLLIMTEVEKMDALRAEVDARFSNDCHIVKSFASYLEFLPKNANKGAGLKALCETLGVALEEVAAFGDNENDREMLETAGHGVCVANADPALKSKVTARLSKWTNEEAAVARELAEMCGIEEETEAVC